MIEEAKMKKNEPVNRAIGTIERCFKLLLHTNVAKICGRHVSAFRLRTEYTLLKKRVFVFQEYIDMLLREDLVVR